MKTMKYFSLVVIALMMSVNLVSCGGGDGEEDPLIPEEPKYKHSEYAQMGSVIYFRYPYFGWGEGISSFRNYMSDFQLTQVTGGYYGYEGKYREAATIYKVDDNEKLITSAILIPVIKVDLELLLTMLKEDYDYIGVKDKVYVLTSKDQKEGLTFYLTTISKVLVYQLLWMEVPDEYKTKATSEALMDYLIDCSKSFKLEAE